MILLMKVKDESEKVVLKFNIQKSKIMIFSLTTSWQIYRGKKKNVVDGSEWTSYVLIIFNLITLENCRKGCSYGILNVNVLLSPVFS